MAAPTLIQSIGRWALPGGRFVPTPDYEPRLHAFIIDGDDNDLEGKARLSTCSVEYGVVRCEGVAIEDFNKTCQEINVIILGMAYPEYEIAFASHALFNAYRHN